MNKLFRNRRFVVLTVAGAALMTAGLAKAQPNRDAGADLRGRTQAHVAAFLDKLGQGAQAMNLTAAQKSKLKQSARKHFPEARAIWNDGTLTRGEKIVKIKSLGSDSHKVLTPEQRAQAMDLKDEAIAGVFSQMRWVSDELDLTGDQQDKIRRIMLDSFRKGADIKTQNKDGKPNFTALRGLVMSTQTRINAVLTPEQQSKWSVIRAATRDEFVKRAKAWRAANA